MLMLMLMSQAWAMIGRLLLIAGTCLHIPHAPSHECDDCLALPADADFNKTDAIPSLDGWSHAHLFYAVRGLSGPEHLKCFSS